DTARPPSAHVCAILRVVVAKGLAKRRLLIGDYEEMRHGHEEPDVAEQPPRPVIQGRAAHRERGTGEHRITDDRVRAPGDQPPRRIKRKRRALADGDEREHAGDVQHRAGRQHEKTGNLLRSYLLWPCQARRLEHPRRHGNQDESDEQRPIGQRANQDEHDAPPCYGCNVAANARSSRITSVSFERNMKRLAPGSSTIFAAGTLARRSLSHFAVMMFSTSTSRRRNAARCKSFWIT